VVVLDEISQTPTAEVEVVLAAVDACPGGSIWVLGDPRQSQPVGAGGAADHLARMAASGRIPAARLTVNRRQIDAADREALDLLRRGNPAASQDLRGEHGWEHELETPRETRQAMAQAVCADIDKFGPERVAALVVSHTDAEDLADRIRSHLADTGVLSGPAMTGAGWITDRTYQAGDQVLLHARCGPAGTWLVNGTTATVTRVTSAGLLVRPDGSGGDSLLPAAFVAGTRKDGSPNLSHGWVRTVDGAQGGTWEVCHLLGSSALDAYRGYTGQSRSRLPTHTWNTTRVAVVDHGGVLADRREGAEQVAEALARYPDPTLAARSDPWTLDRQLRHLIAEHEQVLSGRPPDRHEALAAATDELDRARAGLANTEAVFGATARELQALGPLAGLSRHGRDQRRRLQVRLESDTHRVRNNRDRYDEVASRVDQLRDQLRRYERFESVEGWRQADIVRLREQLDHHWADVVALCVAADDPLAYGIDKLRHARTTVISDRRATDGTIPDDRAQEWQQARHQLPGLVQQRHQAEQQLADSQARLQDAGRRRWGRHDHDAMASAQAELAVDQLRAEQAVTAERDLRDRLGALVEHQQDRQHVIAETAPKRKALDTRLAQIDAALDRSRPDRVAALAEHPPPHLVTLIGSAPDSPAGRAVWCHYAQPIEAELDHNNGSSRRGNGSPQIDRARRQIAVADRVLKARSDRPGPAEWDRLAQQAGAVIDQARREARSRNMQETAAQWQEPHRTPWFDPGAGREELGIGM
jgi:AAA domain